MSAMANKYDKFRADFINGKAGKSAELRAMRDAAGYTLDDMAAALHMSKRAYQNLEAGRVELSPSDWFCFRTVCLSAASRKK